MDSARFLTKRKAAEYLGVTQAQLSRFQAKRLIPYIPMTAHTCLFDRAELEKAVLARQIGRTEPDRPKPSAQLLRNLAATIEDREPTTEERRARLAQ